MAFCAHPPRPNCNHTKTVGISCVRKKSRPAISAFLLLGRESGTVLLLNRLAADCASKGVPFYLEGQDGHCDDGDECCEGHTHLKGREVHAEDRDAAV